MTFLYKVMNNEYQSYLKSKRWVEVREAVGERSGGVCERCHHFPAVVVHHLKYEGVIFQELKYDNLKHLQHVCRYCDSFYHPECYGGCFEHRLLRALPTDIEECVGVTKIADLMGRPQTPVEDVIWWLERLAQSLPVTRVNGEIVKGMHRYNYYYLNLNGA